MNITKSKYINVGTEVTDLEVENDIIENTGSWKYLSAVIEKQVRDLVNIK